jgi:hypothetical protein
LRRHWPATVVSSNVQSLWIIEIRSSVVILGRPLSFGV